MDTSVCKLTYCNRMCMYTHTQTLDKHAAHRYRCVYTSTYRTHHNQPHTNTHTSVYPLHTHTHTHTQVCMHTVHRMCACTERVHTICIYTTCTQTETTNTQHCVIMTQDTHVSNQEYIKYIHVHTISLTQNIFDPKEKIWVFGHHSVSVFHSRR